MKETIEQFDSESGYRAAIDRTLALAVREIRIFDRDLARMGLDDSTHVAALRAFLAAGRARRIRIVLHDTGPLERQMARLLTLLRSHAHAIEVRRTPEHLRSLADSWVIADQSHGTVRFHEDQPRGRLVIGAANEIQPWWQRFDDLWEQSEPCSPGAVTGL
jgi:hypothetical protein